MRKQQRVLLLAVLAVTALAVLIISHYYNPEQVFTLTGPLALALFFVIIVLEVIIAPVPGGVIGLLGAATFGFWKAWPIMYAANVLGAFIAFTLARTLGQPFVDKNIKQATQQRYNQWLDKHPRIVAIAYTLPVFPIDTISILLGLTKMRRKPFMLLIVVALPFYTGITAYLGATIGPHIPYLEVLGLGVFVFLVVSVLYVVFRRY